MRILVAEDDPVQRRFLAALLTKEGHEVLEAADGSAAWAELKSANPPRLAILDWMMPKMQGLEVCREVRKHEKHHIYIILLTAKADKEHMVLGLDSGADDYLPKPFDVRELSARLRVGQRFLKMQDRLLAAVESQRHQATHDPLTGLLNRGAVMEALRRELARARREQKEVAVIMADLDHFKSINDSLGHIAGDRVLVETATMLRSLARTYDHVGRYGGEEFLIVLPGCAMSHAVSRAEGILVKCRCEVGAELRRPQLVTLSMGVATASDPASFDGVLLQADSALYSAKRLGRNRVERYVPDALSGTALPATIPDANSPL